MCPLYIGTNPLPVTCNVNVRNAPLIMSCEKYGWIRHRLANVLPSIVLAFVDIFFSELQLTL